MVFRTWGEYIFTTVYKAKPTTPTRANPIPKNQLFSPPTITAAPGNEEVDGLVPLVGVLAGGGKVVVAVPVVF